MKTKIVLAILLGLFIPRPALKATNYTNYGTFVAYNLNSGDTLRIAQGTFTGVITQLPAGAVIIVAPNATFSPTVINFWAPVGKIINNGTANFGQIGIGGGFNLNNFGNAFVYGDMSFYSGTLKTVTNAVGASISVTGSFSMNDNTTITNEGYINITGSMNLYSASAQLLNRGVITMGGSLSSQGQFNNQNVVNIFGSLNYWGGQMTNAGQMEPKGSFSISAGLTYVNQCKMITQGTISNNGTLVNNGLVWAGTTNTNADQFTNSGTFTGTAGSKLRTGNFINYSSVTGSGSIYATALTTLGSSATIGVSGVTTDTIVMFDVTRSNPSQIFDNQWGTVRHNVVFRPFAAPDSLQLFATCSDIFKTGAVLPLKWNYFYAKLQQQQPLLTWSAEYEAGMKFEVERSYDNADFRTVTSVVSNSSGAYSFSDANASGQLVYYRIKSTGSNGAVKYSEVRVVKMKEDQAVSFAVYPNPTQDKAVISYKANERTQVAVRLKSAGGQQLVNKVMNMETGMNRVEMSEVSQLKPGVYFIDVLNKGEVVATERLIKQ